MSDNNPIRDLIKIQELELYKEFLDERKKSKEKKPEPWYKWNVNVWKIFLLLMLTWPVAGFAYKNLVLYLWK